MRPARRPGGHAARVRRAGGTTRPQRRIDRLDRWRAVDRACVRARGRRSGRVGVDERCRLRRPRLRGRRRRHHEPRNNRQRAGGSTVTATIETPKSTTAQSLTLTDLVKTYMARGRESFAAVKGINLAIEPG